MVLVQSTETSLWQNCFRKWPPHRTVLCKLHHRGKMVRGNSQQWIARSARDGQVLSSSSVAKSCTSLRLCHVIIFLLRQRRIASKIRVSTQNSNRNSFHAYNVHLVYFWWFSCTMHRTAETPSEFRRSLKTFLFSAYLRITAFWTMRSTNLLTYLLMPLSK